MTELFGKVNFLRTGYDREQVDEFMTKVRSAYEREVVDANGLSPLDIRRAAFDESRGGYKTADVDAALDKLEDAFAKRLREQFVTQHGQEAWNADLQQRAGVLYERLSRNPGTRFSKPSGLKRGYSAKAVDELLDRVTHYFNTGEVVTAQDIRSSTFKRVGKSRAYVEKEVDAFLAKVVDVLLGVG